MMLTAIFVAIGLALANFGYQAIGDQQWAVALDRTWFQTTACLCVALADYLIARSVGAPA